MNMAMEEPAIESSQSQNLATTSFLTPLLVSIMGIGVTALAILFYHMLLVRYCMRRHAARMAALRAFAGEDMGIATGVDEKTLKTIPIITYKKPESGLLNDQSECTVCLADMEEGDMARVLPNCKHLFHVKCIDEWFVGHTSCPVCRVPVGAVAGDVGACSGERDGELVEVDEGRRTVLRHCHSLVLPGEKKKRLTGMELKRSLSMGQSNCVVVDIININNNNVNVNVVDNVDKDWSYYLSFKDESVRRIQRVSSKVKQSFSRMCVGQGQGQGQESGILPY